MAIKAARVLDGLKRVGVAKETEALVRMEAWCCTCEAREWVSIEVARDCFRLNCMFHIALVAL